MFNALVLNQVDGKTIAGVESLTESQLPAGDVTIVVHYSSLNYKDGLAITGTGKIIREFPMTPGIDFSGEVIASDDARYAVGDVVILTGWGVGETHSGGLAEKARVNGDWLVPMPNGFNARQAMIVGTARLTAMLCVQALQNHGVTPDGGDILVTGASGGVGSVAVTLLVQLGFQVTAVTGRAEKNADWLRQLGASNIITRNELSEPAKPLEKARWAGAIDSVGGPMLAKVLAQMQYGGVIAACGLAGNFDLPTTVMPFILRGVTLRGIDSVQCPREQRMAAWANIASLLPAVYYDSAVQEIELNAVVAAAHDIINGQITGRCLVRLA